ncbi:RNA polymerase sigma factor [Pedobacter sp. N23S346]|uniref:RNA polymerase sigma factor n=1 Tax=Pedobacter sp. N23S346 TaxID=3402750 RepID=UPI003AC44600
MIKVLVDGDLQELLTSCKAGDRNAQREIYKRYYSYAMGICIRYATNRTESLEIMNNGFYTLFSNSKLSKQNEAFFENLQKIMIHSIITYYKDEVACTIKKSMRYKAFNDFAPDRDLASHQLLSAVQKLPVIERLTFNLYAIDGYTNAEICKMINITTPSLEKILFTARNTLRNIVI